MRFSELPLVTHGNKSRKREVLVSVFLCSVIDCYAIHVVEMKSVWWSPRILGYRQTCSGNSMMTLIVGIFMYIAWLFLYPNNIGGKDCMLMLNTNVNSAYFARKKRL